MRQRLQFVGDEAGKLLALRQAVAEGLKPPVLVFVSRKERALQLHRSVGLTNTAILTSFSADCFGCWHAQGGGLPSHELPPAGQPAIVARNAVQAYA